MSPLLRLALPVLAAASTAYAASCSASGTSTIQNGGDATAIAACKTFSGSVAIATGTTEDIAFDGLQKLDGDLIVSNNSAIKQLSSNSLETITGSLLLDTIQVLNAVNFAKLKTVSTLKFNALPNLQTLGFTAEVTKADVVDIQNTQLQSLKGINIETIKSMFIANNKFINEISMQLGNVSQSLSLVTNNPEVTIAFPNMIWANNMTFRNCSSVDVPSLQAVNGSLGFYGNVFSNFSAPNLTDIGGALAIVSNTQLTNISMPQLTTVKQNLQIANNTKLSKIDGFPQLKTIGGAFDFSGNMSQISLPALSDVKGAFNLQSTGDVQDTCDKSFKPLKDKGRIQGKYVCIGSVANPGSAGSSPTVTGANAKKTGAASSLNIQGSAMMAGLAAAFFL